MVYVSGERRIGKGDPIAPVDRMHLGSLTKAITATVIGALGEQRRMTPETTIGQVFPELSGKMQPAYRNVSVRQLLAQAGSIPTYRTRESLLWTLALKGTATEQRRAFLERVLAEPSRFEPGTRHESSNAGAAIAGAMVERIGGSPYRQLVQELVFAPLGGRGGVRESRTRGEAPAVGTPADDVRNGNGGHAGQRDLYDAARNRASRRRIAIAAGFRAFSPTALARTQRPRRRVEGDDDSGSASEGSADQSAPGFRDGMGS